MYETRRRAQSAADAAAISAAREYKRHSSGTIRSAALTDAARNGFTVPSGDQVIVNNPPQSGPQAGKGGYFEVIVRRDLSPYFMHVLRPGDVTVQARAVSGVTPGTGCVFVLAEGAKTLNMGGSSLLQVECGIYVDSSSPNAIVTGGTASISATFTNLVASSSSANVSPPPYTGMAAYGDPLADVVPPAYSGCDFNNKKISGGGSETLSPGVYCGGLTVSGGTMVTLLPGVYVLDGGGLKMTSTSTIIGDGVGFYNTSSSGSDYKAIDMSGQSVAQLKAPASGPLAGIIFFTDRNAPALTNKITGSGDSRLEGALYFPTQTLSYAGGTQTNPAPWTQIIVDKLELTGGATLIQDDFAASSVASSIGEAGLFE